METTVGWTRQRKLILQFPQFSKSSLQCCFSTVHRGSQLFSPGPIIRMFRRNVGCGGSLNSSGGDSVEAVQ